MVYSCKKKSHGVYQQIGDSTDPFIPGMSQRLLLQFRLVPFSISPHTAKGRLKHLCAFLVPSLWLINYVLPQRGHREAQRFLELGLRPRRPRLTAEGSPKHLCAFLVPSLWLINYVLPQRGHREAQRFLELGLRPKPQTSTPESEARNEHRGKGINRGEVINSPPFRLQRKAE